MNPPKWIAVALVLTLGIAATMSQMPNPSATASPTVSGLPKGTLLEARIPNNVGALPAPLRDGSQDVTFRVCPEDAAKARQLAQKRGVRLRLEVR